MLRGRGLGVPWNWLNDRPKITSRLDKNLNFEREPCNYLGEENFRQREEQMQSSPGRVCFCASAVTGAIA